jgi:hypothetical protein
MREALRRGATPSGAKCSGYLKAWSREDGSGWGAQALVLLRDVDADRDRLTLVVDAVTPLIGCGR